MATIPLLKSRWLNAEGDKLLFTLKKRDASWICEKLYEKAVISKEVKDKFSTLDHGNLQQELMVRYLLQHVYDRVGDDESLFHSFMKVVNEIDSGVGGEFHKELCLELVQKEEENEADRGEDSNPSEGEYRLCEDDVPLLSELLAPGAAKSKLLGVSLKLGEDQIAECLRECSYKVGLCNILREWIRSNSEVSTLNQLKNSLSSNLVRLKNISDLLDEKFVPQRTIHFDTVKSKPKIVYQSGNRNIVIGKSALLGFQVFSTYTVSYQWKKNGLPLSDNEFYTGTNTAYLFISQINRLSEGQYECTTDIVSSGIFNLRVILPEITNLFINIYSKRPKICSDSWHVRSNDQFVKLALIEKRKPTNDEYSYAIQGNIDDILAAKEEIDYKEAFGQYRSGALVLVEGRPGSGKTTLMHKVTTDWALEGNILIGAEVVLLVPLRFFRSHAKIEISDLLKKFIENDSDRCEFIQNIKKKNGRGLCIIIDGLDEYECKGPNDLIFDLVNKEVLPLAMVIVASRPVGTAMVRQNPEVTLRIEVLGFKSEEIKKYIHNYFESHCDLAYKLVTYLEQHINVRRMCYLPVHTKMVCHLYSKFGEKIPHYETKIYESFTFLTLLRKLSRDSGQTRVASLDNLPNEIKEYFRNICQLAFDMIMKSEQIIFQSQTNFPLLPPGSDTSSLGLVTIDSTADLFGMEDLYAFHHLTFQEYLAAVHMKNQEEELAIKLTKDSKSKLHMVWKFYFGMVKFNSNSLVLKYIMSNLDLENLYKIQCAFESQQPICCDSIRELKESNSLSFKGHNLVPVDFLALSYVISTTQHQFSKLCFQNCTFDEEGIVLFLEKLTSHQCFNIKYLRYHYKHSTLIQLGFLNILLQKLAGLEVLDLENIEMGVDGIKMLTKNVELINLATLKLKMPLKRGKDIQDEVLKLLRFNTAKQDLIIQYTCSESKNSFDACMYLFKLKGVFDYCYNTNYRLLVCFNATPVHSNNWSFNLLTNSVKVIFINCVPTNEDLQQLELIANFMEVYTLDIKLSSKKPKRCSQDLIKTWEVHEILANLLEEIHRFSISSIKNDCIHNLELCSLVRSFCRSGIEFSLYCINSVHDMELEVIKHSSNIYGEVDTISGEEVCKIHVFMFESGVRQLQSQKHNFFCITSKCYRTTEFGYKGLANVLKLDLSLIPADSMVLISVLKQCTKLQSLSIRIGEIEEHVAVAIAVGLNTCTDLQILDLSGNTISSDSAVILASVIKGLDLQELDFCKCNMSSLITSLADGISVCCSLQVLNLSGNKIDSLYALALSNRLKNCTNLTTLNLSDNTIGFDGAIILANRLRNCCNLQILDFGGNNIGSDHAIKLVDLHCDCSSLQILDLSASEIGWYGAIGLAERLKSCSFLQILNLSRNCINSAGAVTLADGVKSCSNLHTLDLSKNNISSNGAAVLCRGLKNCSNLHTLNFSSNQLGLDGAIAISSELKQCQKLETLNIRHNSIYFDGAIALTNVLENITSLKTIDFGKNELSCYSNNLPDEPKVYHNLINLDLSSSGIGFQGIRWLLNIFKNCPNLQKLNLSRNNLGSNSTVSILVKSCTNLHTLDLSYSRINSSSSTLLASWLSHCPNLDTLDLRSNKIGSEGAIALANGLKNCTILRVANFADNGIGFDGAITLANKLRNCTDLDLTSNNLSRDMMKLVHRHDTDLNSLCLSRNNIRLVGVLGLVDRLKGFKNLHTLDLSDNRVGADGALALAKELKNCQFIHTLKFDRNSIGSVGATALAEGLKFCTDLNFLCLDFCVIGSQGAIALANGLKHSKIGILKLSGNCIDSDGAIALADGLKSCRCLNMLNLSINEICSVGAIGLANDLKQCCELQTLDLSWNTIGFDGAVAIAKKLLSCSKIIVGLYKNHLGSDNATDLVKQAKCRTDLRSLNLRECSIDCDGIIGLASELASCNNLNTLNLNLNCIGSKGAIAVANGLKSGSSLQSLDLGLNYIGSDGAVALAEGLRHCKNMKKLILSNNEIHSDGAIALANVLKNLTSLQILDLDSNGINSNGAIALGSTLKSWPNLARLDLSKNNIRYQGAVALADGLKNCMELQAICLEKIHIGPAGLVALAHGLRRCNNLQILNLSYNTISSEGIAVLADVLGNCTNLLSVFLKSCGIDTKGAKVLANKLMACSKLKTLDLDGNNISSECTKYFGGLKSVTYLRL